MFVSDLSPFSRTTHISQGTVVNSRAIHPTLLRVSMGLLSGKLNNYKFLLSKLLSSESHKSGLICQRSLLLSVKTPLNIHWHGIYSNLHISYLKTRFHSHRNNLIILNTFAIFCFVGLSDSATNTHLWGYGSVTLWLTPPYHLPCECNRFPTQPFQI